ncbi:hypothetical protein TVAG_235920 [Trichomonas vaginalis G3]|uniref:Dynein heavy chain linker domain-containing protein n=1 Tax=Trichomonas vaginalis (strain ATCC PRA-98 / G3) TaxID=412133 RepID=A2FBE6_TRIV3|nr:dynein heavy chain family protein family [Trichomonas vaginalis G3]EAX97780.1 hypothetical protein TVAG_235920 [Trichomonas vaginalis G3]KAI5499035.1 dynein heavy chain family protein family [Trichomonas vaginalis G3]|eukprot:XP_001310710.1 hypothetical protein [Trichomonas vaginalis G3]
MEKDHAYTNTLWTKLRFVFIDLCNKKAIYDLTPKSFELLQKIMAMEDFEKHIGKNMVLSIFPSLKYKYQMQNLGDQPVKLLKIQEPTMSSRDSVRKTIRKSLEFPTDKIPRNCKIPTDFNRRSSRSNSSKSDNSSTNGSISKFDYEKFNHRKRTRIDREQFDTIRKKTSAWNLGNDIHNETDALAYVASTDPDQDDIQFHFGKAQSNVNRYQMSIYSQLPNEHEFETITKRGVFSARNGGESEFVPIDEFIESKTDYEMVHQLQFFTSFKVNKLFMKWKLMYFKRSFKSKLAKFNEICYSTKPVFPVVISEFRKELFSLKNYQVFPIRDDGNVGYDDQIQTFKEIFLNFSQKSNEISDKMLFALLEFAKRLNKEYKELVTQETASFLNDDKIPSDLYYINKVPNKKSLGIREERELKAKYKQLLAYYQLEISQIPNFFKFLDKMITSFFLQMFQDQFHYFSNIFIESSHQMKLNIILDYNDHDIVFKPSLEEAQALVNDHINNLLDNLMTFIRPIRIDQSGSEKLKELSDKSRTIADIIQSDAKFSKDLEGIMNVMKLSFKKANETYNCYRPSAVTIAQFRYKWPKMKNDTSDPTIFITNLSKLTEIQSKVQGFKNIYEFDLLRVDCRNLRTFILNFVEKTIEENNKILFTEFENICTSFVRDVYTIMETMTLSNDTLEGAAAFAQNMTIAKSKIPQFQKTFYIINSIYNRALTHASMLIPVLIIHLKSVKTANERLERAFETGENQMRENSLKSKEMIGQRQKVLEERLEQLDRQMRTQFGSFESNISAETAMNDLKKVIEKTDNLQEDVNLFVVLANKLNYNEYDFSEIKTIRDKLSNELEQWKTYSEFMQNINVYYDSPVKEINYRGLIQFLNNNSERELRSKKHPLFDKMANSFSFLYQYLSLFKSFSKLIFDQNQWEMAFKILFTKNDNTLTLRKFLNPMLLNYIDDLNIFIMNQLEKADLNQTFDRYIFNMKNLKFVLFDSKRLNTKVISFPAIYEAQNTCEDFLVYLNSLKNSTFFTTIEKQIIYWDIKIKDIIKILDYIIDFQTQYISLSAATTSTFCSLHYVNEFNLKHFVDEFFRNFIKQIEYNPSILSFTSKLDPENPITDLTNKRKHTIKDIISMKQSALQPLISNKINEPICKENNLTLNGDLLLKCLKEAENRSRHLLSKMGYIIDQMRNQYPRLFLCNDESVIRIILACGNVNCLVDDFLPVFPSLSRFQCNGNTIMGAISTRGEMLQFRNDFMVENISPIEILKRTEYEMKIAVKASIFEALPAHDFTTPSQWIMRYNSQALVIAESIYFSRQINSILSKTSEKREWKEIFEKNQKMLQDICSNIESSPSKCQSLSVLAALKIRQIEILKEIKKDDNFSIENFSWQRHPSHFVTSERGDEYINIKCGTFTFRYGCEMISEPDFWPMTNSEEEFFIAIASSMKQPEISMIKQMTGNRYLVKAFSDFAGLPYYNVEKLNNQILTALFKLKCVINVIDMKQIPNSFPSFYGILENRNQILKCENNFTKIDFDNWNSLISINQTEIPSWIRKRLRPIYVNEINPNDLMQKLSKIRPNIKIPMNIGFDYLEKTIKLHNFKQILNNNNSETNSNTVQFFCWFDISEFILTNKIVTFKNATSFHIPTTLNKKIDELTTIFDRYDSFEYHSQVPYFPQIEYNTKIDIINFDTKLLILTILSALKDKIDIATMELIDVNEDMTVLKIVGVRPIFIRLFKADKQNQKPNAWLSPVLQPIDIIKMALQNQDLVEQIKVLEPLITVFQSNAAETYFDPLNISLSKLAILRSVINVKKKPILEAIDTVFHNKEPIDQKFEIQTALSEFKPIVIVGDDKNWRKETLKNLINSNTKQSDFVLFSSSFNEFLDIPLCIKYENITKNIYRPCFDGETYLCLSDYQNSSDFIQNFVTSLFVFNCVNSKSYGKYIRMTKIHLIITTSQISDFVNIGRSYFPILQPQNVTFQNNVTFSNSINVDILNKITEYSTEHKMEQKLIEFQEKTKNVNEVCLFLSLASLFFGMEILDFITDIPASTVKKYILAKGYNFDWIPFKFYSGILNIIVENHLNAILVGHNSLDVYPISKIENVNFVILEKRFRSQIFKEFVNIGETKRKTVFILDLNIVDCEEVYDLFDFFFYQNDIFDQTSFISQTDIKILQHYFPSENAISEMSKFINFFLICKQNQIENIPKEFLDKMVIVESKYNVKELIPKTDFHYEETALFAPYLSISSDEFEEIVKKRINYFREQYSNVALSLSNIIDFVEIYTNLRPVINNINHGITMTESNEKELFARIDKILAKIDDLETRVHKGNEELKAKINQLQLLQAKIHVQIPNDISTAKAAISSYSMDEQIQMISNWISKKDEFQNYALIFRDIFGYTTLANLIESQLDSKNCNLCLSILNFDLESQNESLLFSKLEKYGLFEDAPPDSPLRKLLTESLISSIPLINVFLTWLKIIVNYYKWNTEIGDLSLEIGEIQAKRESTMQQIDELKKENEDLNEKLKMKENKDSCPTWLLSAYNNDASEVYKMLETTEQLMKDISKFGEFLNDTEHSLKQYSFVITAFEYGFGAIKREERMKIYEQLNLNGLQNPFELIKQPLDFEIIYPIISYIHLFTPSLCDTQMLENSLSYKTSIPFSTTAIFDILFCLRIFPSKNNFIDENNYPKPNYPSPRKIYYDPLDIMTQSIISTHNKVQSCFTSSLENCCEMYAKCMSDNSPLIVFLDDRKSSTDFFVFIDYLQLQIDCNGRFTFQDQILKSCENPEIFLITKTLNVDFTNCSLINCDVDNVEHTIWFDLISVFTVNMQLEKAVEQMIMTSSFKIREGIGSLKRIGDLINDARWSDLFENSQKNLSFRNFSDNVSTNIKIYNTNIQNISTILGQTGDHPMSLQKYKTFTNLLRALSDSLKYDKHSPFEAYLSQRYLQPDTLNSPISPLFALNKIPEISLTFSNLLRNSDRIKFLVNYESSKLKNIIDSKILLFDYNFPKLTEKPVGPMMPQLLQHLSQHYLSMPDGFFSFTSPENIVIPQHFGITVILDDLIPTDLYARCMNSMLSAHNLSLLTIGSFTSLNSPNDLDSIFSLCRKENAVLMIIYDTNLPLFVVDYLQFYSHKNKFNNYFILTNEEDSKNIPHFTSNFYIRVSKFMTMNGATKFLRLTPYYLRLNNNIARAMLYLLLVLAHRNDFPMNLQQIMPFVNSLLEYFTPPFGRDTKRRQLWCKIASTLISSYCQNNVLSDSYVNLFNFFFESEKPKVPFNRNVSLETDAAFQSDIPPTPQEMGMLISYGDFMEKQIVWKKKSEIKTFGISTQKQGKKAFLYNARFNNGSVSTNGDRILYIDEEKFDGIKDLIRVPLFDKEHLFLGYAYLKTSLNLEQYKYCPIFMILIS